MKILKFIKFLILIFIVNSHAFASCLSRIIKSEPQVLRIGDLNNRVLGSITYSGNPQLGGLKAEAHPVMPKMTRFAEKDPRPIERIFVQLGNSGTGELRRKHHSFALDRLGFNEVLKGLSLDFNISDRLENSRVLIEHGPKLIIHGESSTVLEIMYKNPLEAARGSLTEETVVELLVAKQDANTTNGNDSVVLSIKLPKNLLDKLKKLQSSDGDISERLSELQREIESAITDENERKKISYFFELTSEALELNPFFLTPQIIGYYETRSLKLKNLSHTEHLQLSSEMRFYHWSLQYTGNKLLKCLDTIPIAEERSASLGLLEIYLTPINPLAHNLDLQYGDHTQSLISILNNTQFQNPLITKLVSQFNSLSEPSSIQDSLLSKNILAWLIRGTSNLHKLPKKSDITGSGSIDLAFPFQTTNGQNLYLVLSYNEARRSNEERQGSLKKIRIIDEFGKPVPTTGNFSDSISIANNLTPNDDTTIVGINVDGVIIPFRVRLSQDELESYKEFFLEFYKYSTSPTGHPRSLSDLGTINTTSDVNRARNMLRRQNVLNFIIDRTKKFAIGGVLMVSALAGWDALKPEVPTQEIHVHNKKIKKIEQIDGFNSNLGAVTVLATKNSDGTYSFDLIINGTMNPESISNIKLITRSGDIVGFVKNSDYNNSSSTGKFVIEEN